MAKTRTLTIRLIKEGLDESEIIKAGERLRSTKLKGIYDFSGNIYYKPSATKPPGWVTFLSAAASSPLRDLFSAQASALLIISVGKRRFALSFGHSWQWLEESAIERRFGLLAALNCIEDDQIKMVDAQQIDSLALSRRAKLSHSSEIMAFGLDVRRDLMRATVGRPKSKEIGTNIMGADALRIVCKLDFEDLGMKCEQLLALSKEKNYQTEYPWVDNIEIVRNPDEKSRLDAILVDHINRQDTEGIYLSPPRIGDLSSDEECYPFDKDQRRFDIDFEEFLEGIRSKLPISLNFTLKQVNSV